MGETFGKNIKALISKIEKQNNLDVKNFKSVIDNYISIDESGIKNDSDLNLYHRLDEKIHTIIIDFLNHCLKKKEDSQLKVAINAAIKIENLESLFHFSSFLIEKDDEKNIQFLMEELSRQIDIHKIQDNQDLESLFDYFVDKKNSSILELLNKFNDEYKWFIFPEIKYDLARYYYDQNNFDSSIRPSRIISFNLKSLLLVRLIFGCINVTDREALLSGGLVFE